MNVKDKTKLKKKFASNLGPSISFKYLALTAGTASESEQVPGKRKNKQDQGNTFGLLDMATIQISVGG